MRLGRLLSLVGACLSIAACAGAYVAGDVGPHTSTATTRPNG